MPHVEIVCDLKRGIPFRSDVFDEIIAIDILEHILDVFALMAEIHRVMKMKAFLRIKTNYWKNENAYTDPSHLHFFTRHSVDYFDLTREFGKKYGYYTKAKFNILSQWMDGQEQIFVLQKM